MGALSGQLPFPSSDGFAREDFLEILASNVRSHNESASEHFWNCIVCKSDFGGKKLARSKESRILPRIGSFTNLFA